jgi:hypothetical protein
MKNPAGIASLQAGSGDPAMRSTSGAILTQPNLIILDLRNVRHINEVVLAVSGTALGQLDLVALDLEAD